MSDARYRPTLGMLVALQAVMVVGRGAGDPIDLHRCRTRGLIDRQGGVTPLGRQLLEREVRRG